MNLQTQLSFSDCSEIEQSIGLEVGEGGGANQGETLDNNVHPTGNKGNICDIIHSAAEDV